jgi:hypothetical protein
MVCMLFTAMPFVISRSGIKNEAGCEWKESCFYEEWCIFMYLGLDYLRINKSVFLFGIFCADNCRPCPENGLCLNGELRCIPGFRRQGVQCVPDKQIDRNAQSLVTSFV